MAEALKTFFSRDLVRRMAAEIARVHPAFDVAAFVASATRGLDALELLDRGRLIAKALGEHLPPEYPEAIDVLLRSLGPRHASDELQGAGMGPFFYLPHLTFVAERGLRHFDVSMRAQYELTKRFTAEFSIRSFLAHEPERTLGVLRSWASDPDPHVRRLSSEGTRLRLPWGMRVRFLDENPARVLELLELLKDDPATLVRRSVANNLNDLGKVHPELLLSTCARWLEGAGAERRALIEHALRSAIKRGDRGALSLLGYGGRPRVALEEVRLSPAYVEIGGKLDVQFTLRSTARTRQDLLVDLAVHFVKAREGGAAKVFKLKRIELPPGGRATLRKSISLAVHTTRKPRPGEHRVDVLVNGATQFAGTFQVMASKKAAAKKAAKKTPTKKTPTKKTSATKSGGSVIDGYLANVEGPIKATLEQLRASILRVLPDAEECISYGMPAFRYRGKVIGGFQATSKGGSYYPFSGTTLSTLADELEGWSQTKSAVHFTSERPLPLALVRKLLAARKAEIQG